MLLDVVNQHAIGSDARIGSQNVQDHSRSFILVCEMRRVDEEQLVGLHREINLLLENGRFIGRVLVKADLTDAKNAGPIEKLRDGGDHLARQRNVLSLLGVDAQPAHVVDTELGGTRRLDLREMTKVVDESLYRAAIEPRPKRRFRNGDTPGSGHTNVIIRNPCDHVYVWIDVVHKALSIPVGTPERATREYHGVKSLGLHESSRQWGS